jgi:hypothetical protein
VEELLCMISLSLVYFFWYGLYFLSLLSFFWHALGTCVIPSFGYVSYFYSFFWHALWACGIPSLGMHLLFLFV